MRIRIALFLFFTISVLSNAQIGPACLSEDQLLNLQALPFADVYKFIETLNLKKDDYDFENHTEKFFGHNLDYSVEKWKNGNLFDKNVLCLYSRAGKPNLIVYHSPDEICFNSLISKQSEVPFRKIENGAFSSVVFKSNGIVTDFREYKNDITSLHYTIIIYNEVSVDEQIQRILAEIARKKAIEEARKSAIKVAIHIGDSLFEKGNYDEAILKYKIAKDSLNEIEKSLFIELESNIQKSQKNKNRVIIENSITKGDTLYNQKQFNDALVNYENALSFYYSNTSNFDPVLVNSSIKPKITSTKAKQDALTLQKTYQSYLSLNPKGFYSFRDRNYKTIDTMISELKRSGYVGYRSVVKFDAKGSNLSYIKVDSSSNKKINIYLNSIKLSGLDPISILDYYIPSIDEILYKVSWNTYNLHVNSRSSKTQIKPTERSTEDYNFKLRSFISNQNYSKGIFKFEVVEKKLNDKVYNDITLIKYRNNNGPLNSAYSLILPGWGTLKVSDGTKGKGRMTLFLLSSMISAGCKIYSNNEYNKFIESNASSSGEGHYNNANLANQAFLVSGGIAASIYIYDFIWVFRKGIKNISISKVYKNSIKDNPTKVIVSPLKPL